MFRTGFICLALALPLSATAKNTNPPDIRTVETDSTDVFEVLQILVNANAALRARNYAAAKRSYESVLLHDPNLGAARAGLLRVLIATGDAERAALYIDDSFSADAVLIRVLTKTSENPLFDLQEALKTHQDARLWNALGRLQDDERDFATARQSYAMAEFSGQRAGLADNNIGQSHWLAGEYERALAAFEKAVIADPQDIRFDNNRRKTLVKFGHIQTAIAGLTAETASVFLAQAGDLATQDGETRLAKMLYQKSLNLAPRYNPQIAGRLEALEQ